MAKIIVRHEMFNIKRGSFRTNVQSNSFHYTKTPPKQHPLHQGQNLLLR
jgi:hypothetical protein